MHDATLSVLSILIVEDEELLRKQIGAHLEKQGADVTGADTLRAARRFLADLSFDFVLLDVNLPDGRGTDLLKGKELPADSGIIVMTAEGGVNGAVEAIRLLVLAAPAGAAGGAAAGRCQLSGVARDAGRIRVVWPRTWRVHGRPERAHGTVRSGQRWHAVPG